MTPILRSAMNLVMEGKKKLQDVPQQQFNGYKHQLSPYTMLLLQTTT